MTLTLPPTPSGTRLRAAWPCLAPPSPVLAIPSDSLGREENDTLGVTLGGLALCRALLSTSWMAEFSAVGHLAAVLPSVVVPSASTLYPSPELTLRNAGQACACPSASPGLRMSSRFWP